MELPQALDRFLAENVNGVSVDAQAVLAHVIRPPNLHSASSDCGIERGTVLFKPPWPPPGLDRYHLEQIPLDFRHSLRA